MPGSSHSTTRLRQAPMSIRLATTTRLDNAERTIPADEDLYGAYAAMSLPTQTNGVALPLRASDGRMTRQTHLPIWQTSQAETEDMLRRKTPGGTLDAAYNGTFAESDVRPHASKHKLMPQSSGERGITSSAQKSNAYYPSSQIQEHPSASTQDPPVWSSHEAQAISHSRNEHSNGLSHNTPHWPLPCRYNAMDWQYTQNATPQVMQPPYQPPLGPTSSHAFFMNNSQYNHSAVPSQYSSDRYQHLPQSWNSYQYQSNPILRPNLDTQYQPQSPSHSTNNSFQLRQSFMPYSVEQGGMDSCWSKPYAQAQTQSSFNDCNYYQLPSTHGSSSSTTTTTLPTSSSPWEPHSPNSILSRAFGLYRDLLAAVQQARAVAEQHKSSGSAWNQKTAPRTQLDRSVQPQWPSAAMQTKETGSHETGTPPGLSTYAQSKIPADSWDNPPQQSYDQLQPYALSSYSNRTYGHPTIHRADTCSPIWGQFSNRYWSSIAELRYAASDVLGTLNSMCETSDGTWVEGMLLDGCLSYVLGEHENAVRWYARILKFDSGNVEATSNLAATYLAQNRRKEAEYYWRQAVRLRPTYFEAIEQLVQLLCYDRRQKEAVQTIDHIQAVLKSRARYEQSSANVQGYPTASNTGLPQGRPTSRYGCAPHDNGRLMALIHAKGNMLYNMHDQLGAARAFEEVILVAVGQIEGGIECLIQSVLAALSVFAPLQTGHPKSQSEDNLLLPPDKALQTAKLCFPYHGDLPGLKAVEHIPFRKIAISLTSNSLLSLAKIFQDGMNPNISPALSFKSHHGVRDILAMYYLSLSLQPSPSTANNVGILLASIQQPQTAKAPAKTSVSDPCTFPGVIPGSGIALALTYYKYGLNLDTKHAHLFTNLGSLLKDIGQLPIAVQMYEKAVQCDPRFDIALANLANAVKDQGKIGDAIKYYRKAVDVNPGFAEAVCGLANALNSVCDWRGRGGMKMKNSIFDRWHVDHNNELRDVRMSGQSLNGWLKRVIDIVELQLEEAESWGRGVLRSQYIDQLCEQLSQFKGKGVSDLSDELRRLLTSWKGRGWEGARIVWLVERATRWITWQWYQDKHVNRNEVSEATYQRPRLPDALSVPGAPTILPFHTFTLPVDAKQVRLISQRNGLRVSCSTLRSSWLPSTVYCPPPPPSPQIKVGYVSSDFNNHPLAHLMQSVFGMHDPELVYAHCYATTASDHSIHRHQIEREAPVFHDAHTWSTERLVEQILADGIHVLVNLNGYTRGARNEVFAARPAPIQMSFMGFAGTLGAEWCDYLLADETAIPKSALRPSRRNVDLLDFKGEAGDSAAGGNDDWVYAENIIYTRDTFFCCDHRQSNSPSSSQSQPQQAPTQTPTPDHTPPPPAPQTWPDELTHRHRLRLQLFPNLPPNALILANFNQLYKIDPATFRTWLRILSRLPHAYLWLLRFPSDGASHLLATATSWAGSHVASRILFTDVAPKALHIARGCVADLFLDTPECNAHTTAADCLWSGTPLLTLPRYGFKMCSRMAAGILGGALSLDTEEGRRAYGELVAGTEEEYEEFAVRLGSDLTYEEADAEAEEQNATNEITNEADDGTSLESKDQNSLATIPQARVRLLEIRKLIWEGRQTCKLFDTRRWVRVLEVAYAEAWRRWVAGEGGDIWLKDLL